MFVYRSNMSLTGHFSQTNTEFNIHINLFHQLTSNDGVVISKDGCTHKLIIQNCKDSDAGLYHFEVNGCKTEAMVRVGGIFYIWLA